MPCERCGADVSIEAAYCSRCGARLDGPEDSPSVEERRAAAAAAFEAGDDPSRVQCPGCEAYRLRALGIDADLTLVTGAVTLTLGVAALLLVILFGDLGSFVPHASTIAIGLVIAGVALLLVARYRRRPRAFECRACGYRVP